MKSAAALLLFIGLTSLAAMLALVPALMRESGFSGTEIRVALIAPPIFGALLAWVVAPRRWVSFFALAWMAFGIAIVLLKSKLLKLDATWPQSIYVLVVTLAIMFLAQSIVMLWRHSRLTNHSSGTPSGPP